MDQSFTLVPALTPQNAASPILDNQIVAMVRNTQRANFFPLIAEGKVYKISNAKVVGASKAFRAVDRNLSLLVFHGTRIEPAEDTGVIPRHKFEITPLEDVGGLVNATNTLIDVIGLVTDYGELESVTNGAKKMDIIVANEREKKMTVTLWEEKAQSFLDALDAAQGVPVFAVVCGLLAKTFADNPTLSSTDATKCYLNIDYKPLHDLRDAIIAATGKSFDLLPPPVNQHAVAANANSFQQLTIKEILEYHLPAGEKLARCLCPAKIEAIIDGEGWYYNCCPKCARKIRLLGQNYFCDNCEENVPDLKQRYKVIVRVRDPSGTTTFTLFNKDVERLVNVPVDKVIAELNQATPPTEIPAVLNNVVGKTCMFEVKINPYNTNLGYEEYTVVKLSESVPKADPPAADPLVPESSGASAKKQKIV